MRWLLALLTLLTAARAGSRLRSAAHHQGTLGCTLLWGANGDEDDRAGYLDFITTWVDCEDNGVVDSSAR